MDNTDDSGVVTVAKLVSARLCVEAGGANEQGLVSPVRPSYWIGGFGNNTQQIKDGRKRVWWGWD